jgi:predicted nucleic acid-binding protein
LGRSVVADAGPLIALGRVGQLALLPKVLGEVLVPQAVITECQIDAAKPGAVAIREALEDRVLVEIADPVSALPPFPVLDAGE